MAHFVRLDDSNIVTLVVVVSNADMLDEQGNEVEALGAAVCEAVVGPGPWVQTSYNNSFRHRYGQTGMAYSSQHDAFILPQPYPSWVIDLEDPDDWVAPIPKPIEEDHHYRWDEIKQEWVAMPKPPIVVLEDE